VSQIRNKIDIANLTQRLGALEERVQKGNPETLAELCRLQAAEIKKLTDRVDRLEKKKNG
jgi:tetrahydromethanopterin S-methyltransferase subunit G